MLPVTRRTYWNPFQELQHEVDRAFNRVARNEGDVQDGSWGSYPVDIREENDSLVVEAELPGFKRDEIDVTFEQGVLSINAVRQPAEEKGQAHLTERRYTRVSRSFRLGSAVDEGKVDAKFENGLLTLTLPKKEEVKPRKIEVK